MDRKKYRDQNVNAYAKNRHATASFIIQLIFN